MQRYHMGISDTDGTKFCQWRKGKPSTNGGALLTKKEETMEAQEQQKDIAQARRELIFGIVMVILILAMFLAKR